VDRDNPTAPADRKLLRASTPKLTLVRYLGLSVSAYTDAVPRATLASLDAHSNRMKFTSMPEPAPVDDCGEYMYHWLAEAAVQALEQVHGDEPQLW
jgi:hypothetical protein